MTVSTLQISQTAINDYNCHDFTTIVELRTTIIKLQRQLSNYIKITTTNVNSGELKIFLSPGCCSKILLIYKLNTCPDFLLPITIIVVNHQHHDSSLVINQPSSIIIINHHHQSSSIVNHDSSPPLFIMIRSATIDIIINYHHHLNTLDHICNSSLKYEDKSNDGNTQYIQILM